MLNLIIKDILLQKKTLLFAFGYSLFILVAFYHPVFRVAAYTMGAVAIAYMLVLGAVAYDERNKSDIILNSLPLKRGSIVHAKYIGMLVFTMIALLIMGFLGAVMKVVGLPIPNRYMGFVDIVGTIVSLGLIGSFYFPIYFRFGYIKSRLFNMIFFVLAFFSPPLAINYLQERYGPESVFLFLTSFNGQFNWLIGLGLILLVFGLMAVSSLVATRIYQKREF